ncbi:MAG: DUF4150 domain-containing protein [Myxococcota bacterium]
MMPASSKGGGQCACFPDVCKTPSPAGPVPAPYPNMAMPTQASGGSCSKKVKIKNKPVIVKGTKIPMSSGDEAGAAGGVKSSKIKGPCEYKKGASKVKAQGKNVCYAGSMTSHNDGNMPAGAQVAPSQNKVTVMP